MRKIRKKAQPTHKEKYLEVTTKERPWQHKYVKVHVPLLLDK